MLPHHPPTPGRPLLFSGVDVLVIDLDGTLAEVKRRRRRLWRDLVRAPLVVPRLPAAVARLRGQRHRNLQDALHDAILTDAGPRIPKQRVARIVERLLTDTWPQMFHDAQPPPQVEALLKLAAAHGIPVAVWSDHPAVAKLRSMGLNGPVRVIDARAVGAYKPLPDALHALAAELGVCTARILMVGDRPDTDGRAAALAGCRFVSVDALVRRLPAA